MPRDFIEKLGSSSSEGVKPRATRPAPAIVRRERVRARLEDQQRARSNADARSLAQTRRLRV